MNKPLDPPRPDPAILAHLSRRRSVPPAFFHAEGPGAEEIDTLLNVAARVPDHGKLVPWRFVLIEGEGRDRLGTVVEAAYRADRPEADEAAVAQERARVTQSPLIVAVVSRAAPHAKIPEWEQVLSAGAVCMNLVHAAHALGYAASWLSGWIAFDRRVLDALGLAPYERIAGYIHVGRARETVPDRPRPALAELVTRY